MGGAVRRHVVAPALFLAVAGRRAAAGPLFKDSANVVELDPEDFDKSVLSGSAAWVVDFYADWCPHCIHFAPVWDQVAGMFRSQESMRFGALNCAAHSSFCSGIGVGSYPTMRAYRLPGVDDSFLRRGSDLHEGEYRVYEEGELVALIRSKLALLQGTGPSFNRTEGRYCSQSTLSVLSPFSANASDRADFVRAREACEVYCLSKARCWGCSAHCGLSGCGWNAIPACGLVLDAEGGAASSVAGISEKRPLPAQPSAATSTAPPPAAAATEARASPATAALRWSDAEVALRYALRQGTAVAAGADGVLQGAALQELALWLVFLARVLPSERARRRLTQLAALAAGGLTQPDGGRLRRVDWLGAVDSEVIDEVPIAAGIEPSPYWRICRTYTCGLWTLFHVVMVAAARSSSHYAAPAGSGGLLARRLGGDDERLIVPPTPAEALARIRGFVAHFFGCAQCVEHFLGTYDSCAFGRCQLRPEDGRGAALWLWQVHNAVTKRVAAEAGRPEPTAWPPAEYCGDCWQQIRSEPRWDSEAVYAYLAVSYWPLQEQQDAGAQGAWDDLLGALRLLWPALALVALVLLWLGHRRRKINSARCAPQGSDSFISSGEASSDCER